MRKEYIQTNPDQLYKAKSSYRSPYLSPSNDQRNFQSTKSPVHRQFDDLDKRFPASNKYEYSEQPILRSPTNQTNYSMYSETPQQQSQIKLTLNQLKNTLRISQQNQQRLQEQLFSQRSKTYELVEVRRRLQEELKRMQFQLDRLTNYEALQSRESSIKLQNTLRENSKLSQQVNDLLQETKILKQQHRKLMSECDTLYKEKQILMNQNQQLLIKLNTLQRDVHEVKREVAQRSMQQIHSQQQINSRINSVVTGRSQHQTTIQGSPRVGSRQSIQLEELPEQVDYEAENQKLLNDYERLLEQNQSMKKLYHQFYKEHQQDTQFYQGQQKSSVQSKIKTQQSQKIIRSFSNKRLAEKLNSSEESVQEQQIMLKTMQKNQITQNITITRDQAVEQLIKCYDKCLQKSQRQHNNSLKLFSQQIIKNIKVHSKMAENYLQMRAAVKEEAGIQFPKSLKEITPNDQKQSMILQIYKSVKDKVKGQGQIGISLAVFRLLTLLKKTTIKGTNLDDIVKHSLLKYIYKMAQQPIEKGKK